MCRQRRCCRIAGVAAPTTKFSGALEEAVPYSITFQTIDSEKTAGGSNTTNAMRVRYCLNDSTSTNEVLWQQVKRWTTAEAPALVSSSECPDNTAGRWDSSYKLASNVTNRVGGQNRAAFTYSAGSTPQIVAVESKLYIDLKPGSQPGESELTTATSLRNANRPPIVSFTATKINTHVLLNGSESRDPEGLALTYKWKEGSTVLPSTSQQYETGALATGSHTFTLEVTDPGGLSSSTSQTVVI